MAGNSLPCAGAFETPAIITKPSSMMSSRCCGGLADYEDHGYYLLLEVAMYLRMSLAVLVGLMTMGYRFSSVMFFAVHVGLEL